MIAVNLQKKWSPFDLQIDIRSILKNYVGKKGFLVKTWVGALQIPNDVLIFIYIYRYIYNIYLYIHIC